MSKEKWVESLLDEMVDSQWSRDLIKEEYERFEKLNLEDLEPISQYSSKELEDREIIEKDFNAQIESFSKSDYEDYLISQAVINIQEDEYFDKIEFEDDYLENLIRQHLDEEKQFLDMVMKEAIAEDDYFQEYIERRVQEEHFPEYPDYHEDDFYIVEYPIEKDPFDDLGDTSYMDQGIFHGGDTDSLEVPFQYTYYERPFFDEDLLDYGDDSYGQSHDYIDIGSEPDDIIIDEPAGENFDELIMQRLIEEKYLDRVFVEIIKKEDYWDNLIRKKLENDEKFNAKINNLH